MKKTEYTTEHLVILCLQALFIILGGSNALYHMILNLDHMVSVSQLNQTTYVLYFLSYLFMLLYSLWGYKHSIVPFRLSLTCFLMSMTLQCSRLMTDIGDASHAVNPRVVLLGLSILVLVAFDNTFKKHKKAALPLCYALVVLQVANSVLRLIDLTSQGASVSTVAAAQPFAGFLISSALAATYAARCHWSINGKIGMFED